MRLRGSRKLSRVEKGEMLLASAELLDNLPGGDEFERTERRSLRLELLRDKEEVARGYAELVELSCRQNLEDVGVGEWAKGRGKGKGREGQ